MDKSESAWAAGLFEGEGSFFCCTSQGRSPRARATLAMTDFEPVEHFRDVVGVGTLGIVTRRKATYKDQLRWLVCNLEGVEHVFRLLSPWLGTRRIEQAEDSMKRQTDAVAIEKAKRGAVCRNGHARVTMDEALRTDQRCNTTIHNGHRVCLDCQRDNRERERKRRLSTTVVPKD